MVADTGMTKTEHRLYLTLSGGTFCSREELHKCLEDPMSDFPITMQVHLSRLRKVLRLRGLDVVSRRSDSGVWGYIMVRMMAGRKE